jgi:hypothetical protein
MIFEYASINPEIRHLITQSSSYTNKYGEHPDIDQSIFANLIKEKETILAENEWVLSIEDPLLYEKMISQIISIQLHENIIYILS